MTKSDQWQSTLRASPGILSDHPNRVHVCRLENKALGSELATLQPITDHMLYPEATAFARDIFDSVRTGVDGFALARIRSDPESHRTALAKDNLNHEQNKAELGELLEATKRFLPGDLQKRMRAAKVSNAERLQIIYNIGVSLLPQVTLRTQRISRTCAHS
jgi:hypothetical protein